MNVKKSIIVSKLIFKKISRSITFEEKEELSDWIGNNPNKSKHIKTICLEDNLKKGLLKHSEFDSNKAYQLFIKKISRTKKIHLAFQAFKYAAGVALLATFSLFLINNYNSLKESSIASKIEPGEKKALLILADNTKINLTDENNATIETFNSVINNESGRLSYEEKDAGEPQNPKLVSSKYNTLIIPKGGEFQLELSDGTKIFINSNSKLEYPEHFIGNVRKVYLEGEAFFEVAHNKSKPFIVETREYNINVLGTSFNICNYENDEMIHTTLVEGKVELSSVKESPNEKIILKPNQQFILDKYNHETKIIEVDTELYTSWTKGYFYFEDETLENIIKKLERWYSLEVFYMNNEIRYKTFSGKLPRFENFNTILKMLENIDNVCFEVNDQTIIIKKP